MCKKFLKEKFTDYRDAVIGNGIYDLIVLLVKMLLGGTVTSTIVNVLVDLLDIEFISKYKIAIICILVLIVIWAIMEAYDRKIRHRPTTPEIVGKYDVIKKEVTFTYGEDCSQYEMNLLVKANENGLNRLHGKYTWSGSDPAVMQCTTKQCNLLPLTRKDSFIEYEIELKKNYKKGSRVECKVVGTMPDSRHTFIPFFSSRITENTRELIINICIPPKYGVKEIICEELAVVRNEHDCSIVESLDIEGRYKWVISHPKLFYQYSVRWEL